MCGACLVAGACVATPVRGASPADAELAFAGGAGARWLGLNGNSSDPGAYLGALDEFEAQGILYDRGNAIEWPAGRLPDEGAWGRGLATSIAAGMVPVVTIEFAGYAGARCRLNRDCLPSRRSVPQLRRGLPQIGRRDAGATTHAPRSSSNRSTSPTFVGPPRSTRRSSRSCFRPRRTPTSPWPDIYVAATGQEWVSEMYAARPILRRLISAWYVHPYGLPDPDDPYGIRSLPALRASMDSGRENLIVSELGYCARDLPRGRECPRASYTLATSEQAAERLTEALAAALLYHQQGWLKALLVYGRGVYEGWGMQLPGGALTAQGEALEAFAALFG